MDVEFLRVLRTKEVDQVISWYAEFLTGRRILEIGSGTGVQLDRLSRISTRLVGIDLADGPYAALADPRVITYDGHRIPFEDNSFDVIFSSNVLEHIAHQAEFQAELARVLAPGGKCVHILPTHTWKLWTTLATTALFPRTLAIAAIASARDRQWRLPKRGGGALDLLFGCRHGEFGGRLSEYFYFRPSTWKRVFQDCNWTVDESRPMGLFYEGNSIFGLWFKIRWRHALANLLGSACHVFVLSHNRANGIEASEN